MKFKNETNQTIVLRKPDIKPGTYKWVYIEPTEIIEIEDIKYAKNKGLTEIKTIKSLTGKTKIETKIIDKKPIKIPKKKKNKK